MEVGKTHLPIRTKGCFVNNDPFAPLNQGLATLDRMIVEDVCHFLEVWVNVKAIDDVKVKDRGVDIPTLGVGLSEDEEPPADIKASLHDQVRIDTDLIGQVRYVLLLDWGIRFVLVTKRMLGTWTIEARTRI